MASEVDVWARAMELAAKVKAESEIQLRALKKHLDKGDGEPWRGPSWCPPTVETAASAVAFWDEWKDTRFAQPLVVAFRGWRLEDARFYVESDGHDPNGQW